MRKTCLNAITVFILSLFITPLFGVVFAASLSLTHIGTLATNGAKYSEWWYTGTSFSLKGTASSGASVSIKIDDDTKQVTADSQGNWTHTVTLTQSDYDVTITSGSETYSFVLHAGQYLPADISETTQSTGSKGAVPPTGYSQILGIVVSSTLLFTGFYLYLQGRKQTKKAYIKSLLNSLK